ncbi:MAG: tripartite tricarboxylate transporter TctB family protein [Paracoccaceae bacterium]|jgi:hypothetical protein|nr:tripartite tricarboxylate transporter TctB family protein [Paracoccaceae bacterium]
MAERDEKEPNDLGHIAFIAVIALVTGAYLWDVVSVSTNINNIILVVPLAILLLVLAAVLLVSSVIARSRGARAQEAPPEPADPSEPSAGAEIAAQSGDDIRRALTLLAGLGAYVWLYDVIGLDVATFIFVAVGMLLLGIRGRVFVPVFSTIFTLIVVGGADLLLHYPMFTVVLP